MEIYFNKVLHHFSITSDLVFKFMKTQRYYSVLESNENEPIDGGCLTTQIGQTAVESRKVKLPL